MRKPKDQLDRFWKHVEKTESCWIWRGTLISCGYGIMRIEGTLKYVHRLVYEAYKGAIPKGLLVCHSCDTRACVNPEHLFLGTHKDNSNDMVRKRRSTFGEHHPFVKLTSDNVREIRKLNEAGIMNRRQIAKRFGVSMGCIQGVTDRVNWKSVD
jgi:hypothetical protein